MSEWLIDLFIPGTPRAQGSMKHVGRGRMIHEPKLVEWRNWMIESLQAWVRAHFGGWEPLDEPVEVAASFWLPRPANPRLEHAATGLDVDKLQRAAGDALEKSGVLKNDARIVRWINPEKDWTHDFTGDGSIPGVRLKVRTRS
ncbi:RusA family crossover junction endodeoxyribonuclease [Brevibacterium sediminis]